MQVFKGVVEKKKNGKSWENTSSYVITEKIM